GRLASTGSGLTAVSASRQLIEGTIRARIRAVPNVSIMDGCDIVGLVASAGGHRVTGVRGVRHPGPTAAVRDAALGVDATGRGSRTPVWLTELGYRRPVEERLDIRLGYATRVYAVAPDAFRGDAVVVNGRYPGQLRGGVAQLIEGGRCVVSLIGMR